MFLKGVLSVAFGCIATISLSAQDFVESPEFLQPVNSPSLDIGDFDQDGWADFFLTGGGPSSDQPFVALFRNSAGTLVDSAAQIRPMRVGDARLFDLDSDNDLDLVLCGYTDVGFEYIFEIYKNENGAFTKVTGSFPALYTTTMDIADFNGDALPDIAYAGYQDSIETHLLINLGNFNFVDAGQLLPQFQGSVCWIDIDSDGDQDLFLSGNNRGTHRSVFMVNNFNGSFTERPAFPGRAPTLAKVGDFNNDSLPDLFISGWTQEPDFVPYAEIYTNAGNAQFEFALEIAPLGPSDSNGPGQMLADYDHDGRLDLAFFAGAWPVYSAAIYRNEEAGFTRKIDFGSFVGTTTWGDLNNDGKLDLFATRYSSIGMEPGRIYLNQTTSSNPIPEPPSNLSASHSTDTTTLSWSAGADPNQPRGHTFNLRIGSAPALADILAPMADLATGRRYIFQPGNARYLSQYKLKLPPGTYYWAVQTIDHSYASSAWSTEHQFAVTPQKPQLLGIAAQSSGISAATVSAAILGRDENTSVWVEYGLADTYGLRTAPMPVASSQVSVALQNLNPADEYHFRFIAENNVGRTESADYVFRTARFEPLSGLFPPVQADSFAWGDYDNDNDLDLMVMMRNGTDAKLFNNKSGTFTVVNQNFPNYYYSQAAWGDLDNDNDLDLVFIGRQNAPRSAIYTNHNGIFGLKSNPGIAGFSSGWVSWADFNNDGRLDLAINGYTNFSSPSRGMRLYSNLGNAAFRDLRLSLRGGLDSASQWADFDGDLDLDLLEGSGPVRNDGTTFVQLLPWAGEGYGASWADFDRDGDLDFVSTSISRGLVQNDNGQFTNKVFAPDQVSNDSHALVGDFDANGFNDFLILWRESGLYLNHAGRFDSRESVPVRGGLHAASLADYDSDGRLDFCYFDATSVNLARNRSPGSLQPPAIPSNCSAVKTAQGIIFSWTGVSDADVTYNIRVGTEPLKSDLVTPMSDPLTGFRRIPAPGNAGINHSFLLKGSTDNKIYWSVQAVNNVYAGGPFASEAIFDPSAPVRPQLIIAPPADPQLFQFQFGCQPGVSYRVETSPDLAAWQPFTNLTATTQSATISLKLGNLQFFRVIAE